MPEARFMQLAIDAARLGIAKGGYPYGAAIVRDGQLICAVHNLVTTNMDVTAHAEVTAIRDACRLEQALDFSGCDIYCTCEPCAMCLAACHWANFSTIIYGASIDDKVPFGLFDIGPRAAELTRHMRKPSTLIQDFLRPECVELFAAFRGIKYDKVNG